MNLKIPFIILSFLLLNFSAFSQDLIYKKDGTRLDVKLLEVRQSEIWYKKWTYQDGPDISIRTSEVLLIQYANGETQVFNNETTPTAGNQKNGKNVNGIEYDFTSNIAFNPVALFNSNISLSYEKFYKNGRKSFRLPVYYGMNYGTILVKPEFRTYSKGNKPVKYFISPMFIGGTYPRISSSGNYSGNRLLLGTLINNGVYFQLGKSFNMSLELGLGFNWTQQYDFTLGTNLGLNFGWRF